MANSRPVGFLGWRTDLGKTAGRSIGVLLLCRDFSSKLMYFRYSINYFGLEMLPQSSVPVVLQMPHSPCPPGSVWHAGSITQGLSQRASLLWRHLTVVFCLFFFSTLHFGRNKIQKLQYFSFKRCSVTPDLTLLVYNQIAKKAFCKQSRESTSLDHCTVGYLRQKKEDKYVFAGVPVSRCDGWRHLPQGRHHSSQRQELTAPPMLSNVHDPSMQPTGLFRCLLIRGQCLM